MPSSSKSPSPGDAGEELGPGGMRGDEVNRLCPGVFGVPAPRFRPVKWTKSPTPPSVAHLAVRGGEAGHLLCSWATQALSCSGTQLPPKTSIIASGF